MKPRASFGLSSWSKGLAHRDEEMSTNMHVHVSRLKASRETRVFITVIST